MAEKEPRQPTHRAYSVIRREGQDDYWLNIGLVFPHKDNGGFNIMLQAFPLDGKIVCREIAEGEEPTENKRPYGRSSRTGRVAPAAEGVKWTNLASARPRDQKHRVLQHRTRASRGWPCLRVDVGNDGRRPGAAASHPRDRVRHCCDDRRRACRYPTGRSKGLSWPLAIFPAAQGRTRTTSRRQSRRLSFCYDGARPRAPKRGSSI
jgi:hypothetical protein